MAYSYSSQLYSLLWLCSLYHILSFLPLTGTQGSLKKYGNSMSDMKQDRGTADLSMQLAHVDCVIVQL